MGTDPFSVGAWPPASFLGRIPEPERALLVAEGARTHVPARTELLRQGVRPQELVVLLDGSAEGVHAAHDGNAVRMVAYGSGDAIGLVEVSVGRVALWSVHTTTPGLVLGIPSAVVRRIVSATPVAEAVIRVLGIRAHDEEQHRLSRAVAGTRRLVGHWVLALADRSGDRRPDGTVVVRCTQSELASWAGLSRETVVKHLHALRADGLVATTRNHLTVLDVGRLRELVD